MTDIPLKVAEQLDLVKLVERKDVAILHDIKVMAALGWLMAQKPGEFDALLVDLEDRGIPRIGTLRKRVERFVASEAGAGAGAVGDAQRFVTEVRPHLIRWRKDWFDYVGSHYRDVEAEAIRAGLRGWKPLMDKRDIDDLEDALRGVVLKDRDDDQPPCWLLSEPGDPPAHEMLSCQNGLLHLPTGRLMPHTPRLFTRNAIDVPFDPEAPEPVEWLKFLDAAWGDDVEQIRRLQETVGYLVSTSTSMQKFFMLLGPTRSGKGVITRTVTGLVGKRNVCSPTLDSVGTRFGLETALGKTLATVSDMRLGQRTDKQNIVGNILRITGEDDVDVERKFVGGAWTGKLGIRILISTNLPPSLPDVTGALVGRLVALKMTRSFLGNEDRGLEARLASEMSGILNWAVAGWRRLQEQGDFTETEAGQEVVDRMRRLASPVGSFLEDECRLGYDEIGEALRVRKFDLWEAFQEYCRQHGMPPTYVSPQHFHRDLEAATQYSISQHKPRTGEVGADGLRAQEYWWYGIGLR
jgi:putative DNA primase/helicase